MAGFSGDSGPANSAQLNLPFGVAVDSSGNLFIAEQGNHRVRKVKAAVATDLAVTMTDLPDPIHTGNNLTYSIAVTNNGPDTANSVTVTDALPSGVPFVSASGSCSGTSTVTCNLATLANGATATVTIVTTVTATSVFSNTASVSATKDDPTPGIDPGSHRLGLHWPGRAHGWGGARDDEV